MLHGSMLYDVAGGINIFLSNNKKIDVEIKIEVDFFLL